MKKYYILRSDGSSIFVKSYPMEFIMQCYYHLICRSDEAYTVIEALEVRTVPHSLYLQNFKTCLMLTERSEASTYEVMFHQGCSTQELITR